MNSLVAQQLLRPRAQSLWIAVVVLQPLLKHFVNGDTLPSRSVIVVDWIKCAKAQNRLRIKSERVGIQAIDRGDRNTVWSLLSRGIRLRPRNWLRGTRIVECSNQALERNIAWQAAADRIEPKQESRRDCRRTAVAPGSGNQDFRRSERTCEVMRRKADPKFQTR
jgi:hypothetical protein